MPDVSLMSNLLQPQPDSRPEVTPSKLRPVSVQSVVVDVSGFPTTPGSGTFTQAVMNGADKKIEQVSCVLQWPPSTTVSYWHRSVNGRWRLWLYQVQRDGSNAPITAPIQVTNPRTVPFLLGSASARLESWRPIYLQIDRQAPTPAGSDVPFWKDAAELILTITMS